MTTDTYFLIALTAINVMVWVNCLIAENRTRKQMKHLYEEAYRRCQMEMFRIEETTLNRVDNKIDWKFRQWQESAKK